MANQLLTNLNFNLESNLRLEIIKEFVKFQDLIYASKNKDLIAVCKNELIQKNNYFYEKLSFLESEYIQSVVYYRLSYNLKIRIINMLLKNLNYFLYCDLSPKKDLIDENNDLINCLLKLQVEDDNDDSSQVDDGNDDSNQVESGNSSDQVEDDASGNLFYFFFFFSLKLIKL